MAGKPDAPSAIPPVPIRVLLAVAPKIDQVTIQDALCDLVEAYRTSVILVHGDAPAGGERLAVRLWRSWGLRDEPHPSPAGAGEAAAAWCDVQLVATGPAVCLAVGYATPAASVRAGLAELTGIPVVCYAPGGSVS